MDSSLPQYKRSTELSFLQRPVINYGLAFVIGAILATGAAILIFEQEWYYLAALLAAIPVSILFLTYPMTTVMVWLTVLPFFLIATNSGSRLLYTAIHRAMVPATLLLALGFYGLGIRKQVDVRVNIVDAAMIIFLAYSLANIMLLSATPDSNLIRFYDRVVIPFCLYWLIRILTPSVKDLRRLAPLAVGIIWIQFAIGLAQWFMPSILPNAWLSRLGERTTGSFGNPGTFTITMIFSALVLIQYAVSANTKRQRVIPFISIGIAFFSVFLSFSRGSWLGALLVIVGLVYLYPRVMSKLFFAAVMIGTIVLLVFLSSFAEFAMERLETQSTVAGRLIGGAATMQLIRLKPALGWGYGNHDLYDEQFRGRVLDFAVNNEHSSHNTYLLIASEMGLIGLALYLFPAAYLLVRSFKLRKQMAPGGYMGRTYMIMLWLLIGDIFIIANFTDLFQSNLFSSGIWWVTLGLIATIVTRTEKRSAVQIYPLNP